MDQQAKSECGQDPQPEGGHKGLGLAQQMLSLGFIFRQQLPVLSLVEVGPLLSLAVVVAIVAVREVLDEQDAVGTLVAWLTALLHLLPMAPPISGVAGLHGATQVVARVLGQGDFLQWGLLWRGWEGSCEEGLRAPRVGCVLPY